MCVTGRQTSWSMWTLLTSFPMHVTERLRGSTRVRKAVYRRPLFPVLAWQRNSRTILRGLSHLHSRFWARLALEPHTCSISFFSIIVPIPLCPFVSSKVPSFIPQEKKSARYCRFESLSDSGFIAQNMAFYRPYKA